MKYQAKPRLEPPVVDNPHVLLVEDLQISQLGMASCLESWGCTVTTANTAAEALEKTAAYFYDLIYMDIQLPDSSGIHVTKMIRHSPENFNRYTPIIGITATPSEKIVALCLEAGMETVVPKPLSKDSHMAICESHLGIPLACIDLKLSKQLAMNDEYLAKDMLQLLYVTMEKDLPEIEKAFRSNDGEQFYFLLHRIYGGVLQIGAPELQVSCKKLEQAYREQSKDVLSRFDDFTRAARRFQDFYQAQVIQ